MKELAKTYDPRGMEDRIYEKWLQKKYFHAEVDRRKKPINLRSMSVRNTSSGG